MFRRYWCKEGTPTIFVMLLSHCIICSMGKYWVFNVMLMTLLKRSLFFQNFATSLAILLQVSSIAWFFTWRKWSTDTDRRSTGSCSPFVSHSEHIWAGVSPNHWSTYHSNSVGVATMFARAMEAVWSPIFQDEFAGLIFRNAAQITHFTKWRVAPRTINQRSIQHGSSGWNIIRINICGTRIRAWIKIHPWHLFCQGISFIWEINYQIIINSSISFTLQDFPTFSTKIAQFVQDAKCTQLQ